VWRGWCGGGSGSGRKESAWKGEECGSCELMISASKDCFKQETAAIGIDVVLLPNGGVDAVTKRTFLS
jgi:hypothetical protein